MGKESLGPESKESKKTKGERFWKISRNWNALSAVAFAGASLVLPGPAALYGSGVAWNTAQAGGSEVLRRRSKKKRATKKSSE